jgi:hypothetical protein
MSGDPEGLGEPPASDLGSLVAKPFGAAKLLREVRQILASREESGVP